MRRNAPPLFFCRSCLNPLLSEAVFSMMGEVIVVTRHASRLNPLLSEAVFSMEKEMQDVKIYRRVLILF